MHKFLWIPLMSWLTVAACTVGSSYSQNNTNNTNNTNNINNTNNTNNTNNNSGPSDIVNGYWRLTSADVPMELEDGPQSITLTNTPQVFTLSGGAVANLSVVGYFMFNKLTPTTADLTPVMFMLFDDMLNQLPSAPSATSITLSAGNSADEVVISSISGTDTVTFRAVKSGTTLTITFESTTSQDPYTGPTRYVLSYVADSPTLFATQGNIDNFNLVDTNNADATLTRDSWTLLADGYYYQDTSTWTSTAMGFFTWHQIWTYASDDQGTMVEGTLDNNKVGYLWNDGAGTLRFYFYAFDGNGSTRAVTWYTSVNSAANIHAFTVSTCRDSTSSQTDFACTGREFPLSFDIVAP